MVEKGLLEGVEGGELLLVKGGEALGFGAENADTVCDPALLMHGRQSELKILDLLSAYVWNAGRGHRRFSVCPDARRPGRSKPASLQRGCMAAHKADRPTTAFATLLHRVQYIHLDGRRRWPACELAGVEPQTIEVNPEDPVAYVISLNLHRRHLTPSQLSLVGSKAMDIYTGEARARMVEGGRVGGEAKGVETVPHLPTGKARDKAGKTVGVSGKLVGFGTKVLKNGIPELEEAVAAGKLSVARAAKVSSHPKAVQLELMEMAPKVGAGEPLPIRNLIENSHFRVKYFGARCRMVGGGQPCASRFNDCRVRRAPPAPLKTQRREETQ